MALTIRMHRPARTGRKPQTTGTTDQWEGNTVNHVNGSGGRHWTANTAFPIDGKKTDPGPGIVIDGVLPPTFSANILWHTDVRAKTNLGTPWILIGNTLSNLTISCSGKNAIHVLGVQENGADNIPTLEGNVKNLLA